MADLFDKAFSMLMLNEGGNKPDGGYVNDPLDAGGETKYGISKRSYPQIDIAALTLDQAKAIYQRDYWCAYHCGDMPPAIGVTYFDCLVQHPPGVVTKWLQKALGITADGVMGPVTLAAAKAAAKPVAVARDMTLQRRDFCETLSNYSHFKDGWNRRHLDTLIGAIAYGI